MTIEPVDFATFLFNADCGSSTFLYFAVCFHIKLVIWSVVIISLSRWRGHSTTICQISPITLCRETLCSKNKTKFNFQPSKSIGGFHVLFCVQMQSKERAKGESKQGLLKNQPEIIQVSNYCNNGLNTEALTTIIWLKLCYFSIDTSFPSTRCLPRTTPSIYCDSAPFCHILESIVAPKDAKMLAHPCYWSCRSRRSSI